MPNLQHIGEDTNLHHFAMLGIHNLETYLAKYAAFNEWEEHMTQYHQRLEAGDFLAEKPHYADGENPSPVAEAEAPAAPAEPEPMPEPEPEPQPEPPAEPMPDPVVNAEADNDSAVE